jgi:hypothetical protein
MQNEMLGKGHEDIVPWKIYWPKNDVNVPISRFIDRIYFDLTIRTHDNVSDLSFKW